MAEGASRKRPFAACGGTDAEGGGCSSGGVIGHDELTTTAQQLDHLDDTDKDRMKREGRCFACKQRGHRANDRAADGTFVCTVTLPEV